MKRSLRVVGAASLLLASGATAATKTENPAALRTFLRSNRYTGLLNRALATISPDVFQRCPALVSTTSNTMVIKPVMFDQKGSPTSGSWHQLFPISGCGNDTTLNLYFDVLPDGRINTAIGVPGDSHAELTLQKDAFEFVAVAVRASQGDCDGLSVKTTKFEGRDLRYPPPIAFKPVSTSPPRWESWTIVGCGRTWDVPLDFLPSTAGTRVFQPAHIIER